MGACRLTTGTPESTVIGAGDFVSAGLWNLFDALALIQKSAAVAPRPLQVQLSSA